MGSFISATECTHYIVYCAAMHSTILFYHVCPSVCPRLVLCLNEMNIKHIVTLFWQSRTGHHSRF